MENNNNTVVRPLYGHVDMNTAYMVNDYPYGRYRRWCGSSLRCRIRYWVEHKPSHGWRLVSQTENPKNLRWNSPKKGFYHKIAACLYLDERGYVQCAFLNEYNSPQNCLKFAQDFPEYDFTNLLAWALLKVRYTSQILEGKIHMLINGQKQQWSPAEEEDRQKELTLWKELVQLISGKKKE